MVIMENKKRLLLLIDGSALVHRAFHALPPLTVTRTGEPVGAVYGFAMMLIKAINDLKPSHYAIAFDKKAPTFRHQLFEDYKKNRPATPEDLVSQLKRAREVARAFNIPVFELEGYEADDILGALSAQAVSQGIETVILTGDADMMQLVSPLVKVFYPRAGGTFSDAVLYDEEGVRQRYGVDPPLIADLKALKGDPSDNIPGVPGVGDKTALKLVQQFGSIENLLDHLEEIEPAKLRDRIKENVEVIRRSKELATIVRDVPVVLDIDACCQVSRYDRSRVVELFRELGFHSLLPKLPETDSALSMAASEQMRTEITGSTYTLIGDLGSLEELVQELAKQDAIAIFTEGTNPSPMQAQISGIALSPKESEAYYIPVTPAGLTDSQQGLQEVVSRIKPLMESESVAKYIHNGKYDMILFAEQGVKLKNLNFDTMLAAYLLGDKSLSLKDIVFNRMGVEIGSCSIPAGTRQISMFQTDAAQISRYACICADMTGRLTNLLKKELKQQEGLWDLFEKVELPLVSVLAYMERCGVLLDTEVLKQMSIRLGEQLAQIEQKIYAQAGEEFNINSPQQLGLILFEKLHLPGRKIRGKYSTEASVLEELRGYEIVNDILEYRQLMKLKSTYIDALPCLINPKTGRLHTNFNQMRTTTGRLSSSDPNLQNIPVRGELGREIRRAFIAPPGSLLIAGDYSQIDLRVLAHLSQDENLLQAFWEDKDIHAATAAQLFGVDIARVTPEMRRLAKTVNFGVIYGMSEFGLEQATELTREEAGKFITAYFEKYPGVKRYLEATREQARKLGYVQTILGHRRYVPEVNSPNRVVREAAERMAINMPVQGSSSDIIKVAMINLYSDLQARGLKSKMILQVHDELIFEVPEEEVALMTGLIRDRMSTAIRLSVPVKVDIKSGPNWGAME